MITIYANISKFLCPQCAGFCIINFLILFL